MKSFLFIMCMASISFQSYCQRATITGTVRDKQTQELLIGVSVVVDNTDPLVGTVTDGEGNFKLTTEPGSYNVMATFVGYKPQTEFNVLFTSGNVKEITFELEEEQTTLNEVVVDARMTAEAATIETPLSVQKLTTEEIRSNPGGNFDISRVIQALPGVGGATGTASFRNDIIIRGGAPNENVYYLDDIEIPIINHFSTQGSAGGPQGILNVSFIEDVTLSTSAFDSRYDNALSSALQFKQRDGNAERIQGNVRLSATELATTLDGPLTRNTTFLASARRSYLKLLFELIDLPIRPDYWDFQFKLTHNINPRTTLALMGVGAVDRFQFATPEKSSAENTYVLRSNPLINQDSYTVGASFKRLISRGYINLALSRSLLNNRLDKFEDAMQPDESARTGEVRSIEAENKIRADFSRTVHNWKYSAGIMANYVYFDNQVFSVIRRKIEDADGNVIQSPLTYNYTSSLRFFRGGVFAQLSRRLDRLSLSAGIRSDINSFTTKGMNPAKTLSPRVSLSYALSDKWNVSASVGTYYKIPPYTVLGFQDRELYINKNSKYIRSTHYVGGLELLPAPTLRFTLEGFYKRYSDYPVSVLDGISLANAGTQFGQIGSEDVTSSGDGRAFGLELFAQQKLTKGTFFTVSYTWFRSEFTGKEGVYNPSSWDNRNLVSAVVGRKLPRNWELGLKFRYAGASPYTPYDLTLSQMNYLSIGEGVLDYSRVNSFRLRSFKQLDLRVDKKWNLRQTTIVVFIDVQNVTSFKEPGRPRYTFKRTADNIAFETTDGNPVLQDGSNAIPVFLNDDSGSVLPSLGFIVEF